MRRITLSGVVVLAAACGGTDRPSADSGTAKLATDTGMPMATMPARATGSAAMMEQMRSHLQTMRALRADSLRATLAVHAVMTDGMLAQMSRDIMDMRIPANPAWSALMDSVHRDLNAMRGMLGAGLDTVMATHAARLTRLMAMHQAMMVPKRGP